MPVRLTRNPTIFLDQTPVQQCPHCDLRVVTKSENRMSLVRLGVINHVENLARRHAGVVYIEVIRKLLHDDVVVVENDSRLHISRSWANKVVRASATDSATVESALQHGGSRSQCLKNIELAATGLPARTFCSSVLQCAWNLAVQRPDGRLVLIPSELAIIWHHKLHKNGLLGTSETLVRNTSRTNKSAITVGAVLF